MQSPRSIFYAAPKLLAIIFGCMTCLALNDAAAVAQQYPGVKCLIHGNQQCRMKYSAEFNWVRNSKDKESIGKVFFSSQAAATKFKSRVAEKLKLDQAPDESLLLKANHQLALTGQVTQQLCPLSGKPMDQKHQLLIAGVPVCFSDAATKNKVDSLESTWHRAERIFASPAFAKSFVKQVEPQPQAVIAVADGSATTSSNDQIDSKTSPAKR